MKTSAIHSKPGNVGGAPSLASSSSLAKGPIKRHDGPPGRDQKGEPPRSRTTNVP